MYEDLRKYWQQRLEYRIIPGAKYLYLKLLYKVIKLFFFAYSSRREKVTSTRSLINLTVENIRTTPLGNIFRGQVHDELCVYRLMYFSSYDDFFPANFSQVCFIRSFKFSYDKNRCV